MCGNGNRGDGKMGMRMQCWNGMGGNGNRGDGKMGMGMQCWNENG